jgi:hypothetical protein
MQYLGARQLFARQEVRFLRLIKAQSDSPRLRQVRELPTAKESRQAAAGDHNHPALLSIGASLSAGA